MCQFLNQFLKSLLHKNLSSHYAETLTISDDYNFIFCYKLIQCNITHYCRKYNQWPIRGNQDEINVLNH